MLRRKENSSKGTCWRLRARLCYHVSPYGFRNFNLIPFHSVLESTLYRFNQELDLTRNLGPSNPWPIAVRREPFSTSAAKVSIWLFATTTKICTRCRSSQAHAKRFSQHPRPLTHHCILLQWWSSIGRTFERHPFSGLIHSAGESWHTP